MVFDTHISSVWYLIILSVTSRNGPSFAKLSGREERIFAFVAANAQASTAWKIESPRNVLEILSEFKYYAVTIHLGKFGHLI